MLAMLLGCWTSLIRIGRFGDDRGSKLRQGHKAIVDLIGKGGRIPTVPVRQWAKQSASTYDLGGQHQWTGEIFRAVSKRDRVWAKESPRILYLWSRIAGRKLAWRKSHHTICVGPAQSCVTLAGGELEQIQFLLGHASVQTTEPLPWL